MYLYNHLTPERVLIAPDVTGRHDLFDLFGRVFERGGLVGSGADVVQRLTDREGILSTGIGGGWAIPHAQIPGIGRLALAASVHPDSVDYPSLDEKPVKLVVCLLGDANTAADHLAGLARLARLARRPEVLERLLGSSTGTEFLEELRNIEEV